MRCTVSLGMLLLLSQPARALAVAPAGPVDQGARGSGGSPIAAGRRGERVTVHVRFERLSSIAQAAEAQKDVLLGLLRETQGRDALFLESDSLPEGDARVLVVRCVSCGSPAAGEALDVATITLAKPAREGSVAATGPKAYFTIPLARARFGVRPLEAITSETAYEGTPRLDGDAAPPASPAGGGMRSPAPEWIVEVDQLRPKWTVRLRRDVRQGAVLSPEDSAVEACYVANSCPGEAAFGAEADAFRAHDAFQGQEAVRPLARGATLAARDARPPLLVRPGDPVRVNVRTEASGLAIRARGRALQAGARGEAVNVELASQAGAPAGRTLKAVVTAKGEVDYALE